jgi:hypothetical protein
MITIINDFLTKKQPNLWQSKVLIQTTYCQEIPSVNKNTDLHKQERAPHPQEEAKSRKIITTRRNINSSSFTFDGVLVIVQTG